MEGLIQAFVTLFIIMDPVASVPMFLSLSKGLPLKEIKKNVNDSVFVAAIILFVFLFFGIAIFTFFGVNLDSFQIAGGIILLIIGIFYVFGIALKFSKAQSVNLSVPIGTPLLTGPGVITTTIILVKQYGTSTTLVAAVLTLAVTWIVLISSGLGLPMLVG